MKLSIEGCVRRDILEAAYSAGKNGAHIAPSLSIVEISIAVLKEMSSKDLYVLSKGHGALGYYAAMHQMGMISDEMFESFESDGGDFPGQPSKSSMNRITYSSGSLGMGLSYAAGRAFGNRDRYIFVILGDGELNEGSLWEAAALIAKHHLVRIIAIVDKNGLQSDGKTCDILNADEAQIWKAYGWNALETDGHCVEEIISRIQIAQANILQPSVIIANTIKGKGISFMENNNEWHHRELALGDYEKAIVEIGERYGLY